MSKHTTTVESKTVVSGLSNALIPGPDWEAEARDDEGHKATGHGNSKSEAEQDAIDNLHNK